MKTYSKYLASSTVEEVLLTLIVEYPDFPRPGILFRDVTPILRNPEALAAIVRAFRWPWLGDGSRYPDVVVGIESRGYWFGLPLAIELGDPFVPVRKAGKTPGDKDSVSYDLEYGRATLEMQKGSITPGAKVVIVDDLLATGGSADAAAQLVQMQGGIVHGFNFVIELSDLGGSAKLEDKYGVKVHSLLTY